MQPQQNPSGFVPQYAPAAPASQDLVDQYYIGSQQPGFADSIANEKYHIAPQDHKNLKVRSVMLVVGCLMLFLTVLMPIWESSRLMHDPTFVYFIGREYCGIIMVLCLFAILLYAVMILLLFTCAREEGRTQQNVMGTATTVLLVLGLALLLVSQPLKNDSRDAYEELFFRADTGPRTQRLMEYSAVLSALRSQTECASQISVEQCEGYQESQPYTGYLKAIEGSYKCAGFGWGGAGAVPAATIERLTAEAAAAEAAAADAAAAADSAGDDTGDAASDDAGDDTGDVAAAAAEGELVAEAAPAEAAVTVAADGDVVAGVDADASEIGLLTATSKMGIGLLTTSKLAALQTGAARPAKARAGRRPGDAFGIGLLQTGQRVQGRSVEAASASQPPAGVAYGEYPPTLFTDANYQTSCDGMAARVLRYEAMEAADMFYYEGVALVFCAIATMFLQVVGMCTDFSRMSPSQAKTIKFAPARAPQRVA